ncbi:DUF4258 domain-containing protein [Aquisalimonas sp. 2447]|uniref:DUF4258 domain-containing protein n=1 Tax=Aquisalimonas sp. 2447 TaxID=2740807 RepID=UPI00143253C6|nr:DUF4258 domain-containing protein [Aquisalimonas sp. 2447]QIT55840.1 DUF4258 domain-containing protein [Aquisalimonas sp. 2447]
MTELLSRVQELIAKGDVRISEHGYDELADDDLRAREILAGVTAAKVVEEYPDFPKGPAILLLQSDGSGRPVHVVWGIPRGHSGPAVLVTAYRPTPERWDQTFMKRRR